jgi:hypothetical protein
MLVRMHLRLERDKPDRAAADSANRGMSRKVTLSVLCLSSRTRNGYLMSTISAPLGLDHFSHPQPGDHFAHPFHATPPLRLAPLEVGGRNPGPESAGVHYVPRRTSEQGTLQGQDQSVGVHPGTSTVRGRHPGGLEIEEG